MSSKKPGKHKSVRSIKPRVWGVGLVALDLIIDSESAQPRFAAGGTCGNVMTILSRLGWDAFPIARVAHDPAGARVVSDLRLWGVNTNLLHLRPSARTPVIVEKIQKDSAMIPFHTFSFSCPSCGGRLPRFQPVTSASVCELDSPIDRPDVLFIDRVSRGALALAEAALKREAVVFFEPSAGSNPKHFSELREIAHVVKYSHDRIEDTGEVEWGSNMVLEIQTLGRGGLRFRTNLGGKNHRVWRSLPATPVLRLRDAAGAGDWLSGALIHSLCRGGAKRFVKRTFDALLNAFSFGQRLAAWNCGFAGPRGSMYGVPAGEFSKILTRLRLGKTLNPVSEAPALDELLKTASAICESCQSSDKKHRASFTLPRKLIGRG